MLAILSPAKDMQIENVSSKEISFTHPIFYNKAAKLIGELKKMSPANLQTMMKVSEKLALLNFNRFQNWDISSHVSNGTIAIHAFTGEAYRGLDAHSFNVEDLQFAQKTMLILSGLYGMLRPLDIIQAYRLEMGTKHSFLGAKNLYEYWRDTLTDAVDQAVQQAPGDKYLLNVASTEYFSVLKPKKMQSKIIDVAFYEENNGKPKIVTVYAKKARGLFVRFLILNRIEKFDELKAFNSEGYYFDARRSSENQLFFVR
ncbi:MAG TPA: peroxide stress protein YaaA [Prolixibacteraceae bacterium]|nr:peroxide stress protein YaaA [Prolixibacteraceae bacterium]HPR60588.1 peroxide stress protein YaaA [Prolixibacteraceae bacterium]